MAGNVDKVQLQVEVVRNQLDTLIRDVNNLKSQKLSITVDSSGMDAINKFNASMKTLMQNADGVGGKFTQIWKGAAEGAPTRTIETVNEGLGRTTEIIRTLDEETQSYSTTQTKTTANYDEMAKAAQKAAEANQKAEQQAKAYLLQEQQAAAKAAERYDPTPMQQQIEALTGITNASKSAADSAKVFEKAWLDSSDKVSAANQAAAEAAQQAFSSAQDSIPTLQKRFADLSRSIESAKKKYKDGTFDSLAEKVNGARDSLGKLDSDLADGKIGYDEYVQGVDGLKSGLKDLQNEFSQTRAETDNLKKTTNVLGDSLSNVVKKIVAWQVINASVASVIRSFKEAVQTMKEVDTELTAIQKVTNNTDAEMEKLSQHAYEVASQYGVAVTDYLESTGTFAKAGYKEMSEDMAELATKTQLVGDVNAETANQFLLSADAAYKMKGNISELSEVLDKANVIENNYATSIQKIAEGLPNVASIASMTNVSIDELMAALGTITSVTQESGSRASYALRALLLNIMGDTETQIEDGVTWTKEEIESLSDVLWKYSKDAMKAAQATGTIVNPMEAVAGLAQAYKEGVLTQAELAQIESDLGGKLRTNQLDALIKNFDMYSEMLDKVKDSAGSADEEVSIMLDSWESKANILQNTWTEFISHMLNTDVVKGALDALTGTVELLDTGLGRFILTVAGVTAAVFGVVAAVKALQKAVLKLELTSLLNPVLAIGAGLGIVVAGIFAICDAVEDRRYENLVEKFHDLSDEVDKTASSLQTAKEKLDALNETPDDDRGEAWRKEREELDQTIEAYEYLLELRREERDESERKAFSSDVAVGAKAVGLMQNGAGDYQIGGGITLTAKQLEVLQAEYGSTEEAIRACIKALDQFIDSGTKADIAETIAAGNIDDAYEKMRIALGNLGVSFTEVKLTADEYAASTAAGMTRLAQEISGAEETGGKMTKVMNEEYESFITADKGRYQYYLGLRDLGEEQQQYVDAMDAMIAAYIRFSGMQGNAQETIAYIANTLGVTAHQAATLAAEWGLIDRQNIRLADSLEKTEDGLYKVKDAATAAANGAEDAAGAIGDLADVTEYDATTAAAKLTQSLFDANGKLTEHARQALKTNTAMADLAKAELEAQKAAAEANYNNLISQIQMVGTTAAMSAQQLSNMIALSGTSVGADMTSAQQNEFYRLRYRQASGKSADSDPSGYNQWLSQYFTKTASDNYKKQLESIQSQIDQIDSFTSDYSSSSSGGGGSSSDANLTAHQKKVSLLKSELTLMENQGRSAEEQKAKMRQIQQALHAQAEYLRAIGGSQEDINALSSEWWEWQKKINEETADTADLLDELQNAMDERLQEAADERDAELAAIEEEIDALKRQKEEKDEQLTLEEKILAVQQAQADLASAQAERTIRQFNAKTGQWEWVADQKEVDKAKEDLEKAEKELEDYREELEYNAKLAELEAKKDAINARYDALEAQYKKLTDSLKEKTRGIGEILQDIWKNATPELKAIILENAEIFKAFGVDVKALSDAVNDAAREIYGLSSSGERYNIGSAAGQDFVKNASPGDTMTGADGSTWVKNRDGTVTITDKWGRKFTVDGSTGGSGEADSGGGDESDSSGGNKYSGTVYGVSDDGEKYKISSAKGLRFLNEADAGERMEAGDGSTWVKKRNGTTVITDKWGRVFTVYDRGGLLRGMGGIKATERDELVLDPELTQIAKERFASVRNIAPAQDAQSVRILGGIRQMLGGENGRGAVTNANYDNRSVGTQYNGDVYNLNGMTFTEQQVGGMTLREFAREARTLAIRNN